MKKKILLIRLDKIGDLVSTLPVDTVADPDRYEVHWAIAKGLGPLCELARPRRIFHEVDLRDPRRGRKDLVDIIREVRPEIAVIFYAPWWAGFHLWKSKISFRHGRRSQWHSYLFLNSGLRQSRSLSEKHEADYNLDLLRSALGLEDNGCDAPVLQLEAPPLRHLFEKFALQPRRYVVVHPGMAGSALNWPIEHYGEVIRKRLESGEVVAVTGTATDEAWLAPLREILGSHNGLRWLQGACDLRELIFLLSNARAVVAPSTGVLHLAGSLGVPTLGLYSPLRAHNQRRWRARGRQVTILSPEVNCPAQGGCQGPNCPHHICMRQISSERVDQWLSSV